jgi:hypothetical protein
VACLGVTDADWRALGSAALLALRLDVARRAYIRVRDVRFIDLINSLELARTAAGGKLDDTLALGEIFAYQGLFAEAAKHFSKAGQCACRGAAGAAPAALTLPRVQPRARSTCSATSRCGRRRASGVRPATPTRRTSFGGRRTGRWTRATSARPPSCLCSAATMRAPCGWPATTAGWTC